MARNSQSACHFLYWQCWIVLEVEIYNLGNGTVTDYVIGVNPDVLRLG